MISGHPLLADWFFLLAWVIAIICAIGLVADHRALTHKHTGAMGAVALALVAAGLWVL
jgi:hypothetical protein